MRKSGKKLMSVALLCVMLVTLLAGCGGKKSETIKLGWMGSLTGDQAAYGTCESQTLKMLVEEKNAAGGILGKQIELICYDTKGDAQEAVNVAKRLCAQDKVCAIIGPNASGQCIAIQSVLDQYKVSDLSTVATNEKVTVQDGKLKEYNFRVCFLDPQQGKIAGTFVYDNLKFTKAAVLFDINDDYAKGLKDNFIKVFTGKGGTVVAEEAYTGGDTDFTAQLTKIKEAGPEIIFTPIFYQDFIMIHKQARTLGIDLPMLGGDGCASEVLFDAADAVDGSYVINHVSLVDPAGDDFRAKYASKWNGAKMELNGYMAHDAFLLWCAAVEKAGSDDPQAIAKAYCEVEVTGMAGRIKISAEDHNPVGKSGCVEQIDGKNKTYKFITYIAAD
ncbi:MAG: ABC transporter substrate-binding protein [Lachnospiraceae bacterium]|nr:ABC transporter substrate-binding protein [Lachnospiraceae bacterium]